MLVLKREILLDQLLGSAELADAYADHAPDFGRQVRRWLKEAEESLGRLRTPLASLCSAERGRLVATEDGYRDPDVEEGRGIGTRKARRATAALILHRVTEELRAEAERLDERLDGYREKMAQLVAVSSSLEALPERNGRSREAWLRDVWSGLARNGEMEGMYAYLQASLSPTDRAHLLEEVLNRMDPGDGDGEES